MKIYWYAPFENAYELDVAAHIARPDDELVVQTLASRFGNELPHRPLLDLRQDLPEPAGESGRGASLSRRAGVALQRAQRRSRVLGRDTYDLAHVHTYNMFTDWIALRFVRRRCQTMILSVHNVRPHEQRGPRAVESWLHKAGYDVCDHIVVADETLQDQLIDDFRVPSSRITVIPLAIQSVTSFNSAAARSARDFLFFGTFRRNKGIEVLLAAMRSVDPALNLTVRFAGRGETDLEDLVSSAADSDSRIIAEIGWVHPDRQAELFQRAWAVVLPYTSFDAQSGVLRDAYAYRVPVIATDVGALGRAVRDDRSGWIIRPNNSHELARAIAGAATDDQRRSDFVASLGPLSTSASFAAVGARTRALYDEIHPSRLRS